jgi:hypothetical protein
MSQPPASRIGPNRGVVPSPGKKPFGESALWLRHSWIAASSASQLSFWPVGSPPSVAGVTRSPAVNGRRPGEPGATWSGSSPRSELGLDLAMRCSRSFGALC